ncbi:Protein phosphatase 1 regulatory subunit 12B [Myotis davidii]|uniref:Protein phosphatase 1 regulatory subunit 12B n=1 Tax=Myotis davidii TaxID=225400 RepID=L5MB64_MYODS|nr:Protein phosphatase 1 regulatory subunit 12B [Myotis davidii]
MQPGPQSSWGLRLGVTVGVGCGMCVPGPSIKGSVKPGLRPWPFGEHIEPAPHLTGGRLGGWPGGCRARHLRQQSHRQPRLVEVLTELKSDNQRLKDENGALIRVISKLSK